jgi:hypothetical protein
MVFRNNQGYEAMTLLKNNLLICGHIYLINLDTPHACEQTLISGSLYK